MKIGIMGGTFDPIHNGHLMLGQAAYETFHLDQIWFMPNGHPPHKGRTTIEADVDDRIEMVKLAIGGKEEFRLELYEAYREEVSYSYSTLEFFNQRYPEDAFYFIIGADSLFAIETWAHPERLFPTCTVLAAYRDEIHTRAEMEKQIQYLTRKYDARIRLLATPLMSVSSSALRREIKSGKSIAACVPSSVENYIMRNHLYERNGSI